MTKYLNAMRNGFNFHGRASRSEFWLFFLVTWVMSVVTVTLDAALGFADEGALVLTGILYLVHIIPSLAVSVRRLHDIDKSGWWMLISFTGIGAPILLVMFCLASTKGQNHYGPALDGTQAPDAHSGLHSAPEGPSQARHAQSGQLAPTGQPQAALQADRDPLAQLEKLKALHDAGAIDDTEFAKMKADLLSTAG